ncbi:MAG: ribosome maturation factor RimP [Butyrivibrio sp.]|uniref:ribosome maturation factor RimP n=1 Tax=Butyrivibrio sp. TaxID=28121 RepID=UPI0025D19738|nr:ribosome maturation factor RimP [Butyrivibrio sp.]MCR5771324.1 ribosome maturation factor RimP [Butyrivibrio sp.]
MSRKEDIERKTEEILVPIAQKHGTTVYDVEYVKEAGDWYLRAYIDKEGGVNIGDCVDVSHDLSDALDADDFIEDAYTLEVSSPGLGRQLKKDRHFENSLGLDVDLKTYKPVDGCKEFTGVLKAYDADTVTITIQDIDKIFSRKDISVIRLSLDF